MIAILVADDQALVRAGFCALLEATEGLEVVAEAVDGAHAVELTTRHEPDVVLMDIRMPRLDGIAATRQVLALPRPPHVLILTTFDTDDNVFDALEAGAVGFLVKDTPPTQLIEAIHAAMSGGASSHPVPGGFDVNRQEGGGGVLEVLTSRERGVPAMS
jgi:DNA-binding NarL/FixJ family response regulator